MTTYAVVSDIHANYPALASVLDAVEDDVDGLLCLGDVVGLGGFPQECIVAIHDRSEVCVQGNHDVAVINYEEGHTNDHDLSMFELNHTHELADDDLLEWMFWRPLFEMDHDEGLLIAHAKPYPNEWDGYTMGNRGIKPGKFTEVASKVPEEFDFVLLGHTHQQHGLDCEKFGHGVRVVNPGSVGMPIDGDAEYAIIDTEKNEFELCSVEYDNEETFERLEELDVPKRWWEK